MRQQLAPTFKRYLQIASSSSPNEVPLLQTQPIQNAVSGASALQKETALQQPKFEELGTPPSIISCQIPPSVPVYLKKGSLLSIYGYGPGSHLNSIQSSFEHLNPLKCFLYGGINSSFQKIVSVNSFSVLATSSRKRYFGGDGTEKAFATLQLNGAKDWALVNKEALQVYAGNSLTLSLLRFPKRISSKLAKSLKISSLTPTGLFSWYQMGYTLLSGRGDAGIVGLGGIYYLEVEQGEQVVVNKNSILAIEVNSPHDLQTNIVETSTQTIDVESVPESRASKIPLNASGWEKAKQVILSVFSRIASWIKKLRVRPKYIKVMGPRRILVQSGTSSFNASNVSSISNLSRTSSSAKANTSKDYLSYVTVGNRGVNFKSTPDFKETVEKVYRK